MFISGYTAAFIYPRWMVAQRYLAGTAPADPPVWQLDAAHVLLFVFYVAAMVTWRKTTVIPICWTSSTWTH